MHRPNLFVVSAVTLFGFVAVLGTYRAYKRSSNPPARTAISYGKILASMTSSRYSVTVNGLSVPVQLYKTATGNVSFARFSFAGSANLIVTVCEPVSRYLLSPSSYGVRASVASNRISFTLASPQRLVLRKVNRLSEELFLLPDAPEANPPQLGAAGVTDALTQAGIDNKNSHDDSTGINNAINKISASGGGTLFFPAGLYNIQSSVNLKSNVTVYLAAGSVFQVPPYYNCCFQNQGVINFSDVSNARLTGRGIINGNAVNIPQAKQDFHMIYTENARNIEIDDLLLLDEGVTGIRLVDCHNSAVRNVKIIANNPATESDGIDFDSSNDILVDNAFIYSSDDNTSQGGGTGVRHTIKDNYNITVQNSVLYNARTGAAIKIGTTDPQRTIRGETFRNLYIVSAIQIAALYPTQGANIESITLSNINADEIKDRVWEFQIVNPTWESWNGKLGHIHDITVRQASVANFGRRSSIFVGHNAAEDIERIRFSNYSVAGHSIGNLSAAKIDTGAFVAAVSF